MALYEAALDRYRADRQAAVELVAHGEAAHPPGLDPVETAAWITVATALFNLDETITRE
jgi:hypothetical protein